METSTRSAGAPRDATVRAVWVVLAAVWSAQLGSAIGKSAFDSVTPSALTWLRLVASALLLLAWARPAIRGRTRADWTVVVCFGSSLALMNWAFYQALSRIPIGVAVTLEFIGPLTVALVGSRRRRDLVWVGLAATGVALLGVSRTELDPAGVGFALLAGAAWASYILLSARTGRHWPGIDGLTVASLVAVAWLSPAAVITGGSALLEPRVLAAGAAVGLLSSALPYALEITALRTLTPALFGILMSLEPAAAALAGAIVLGELLTWPQILAVACVVCASIGATTTTRRRARDFGLLGD